ncbi:MAG: bifunctional phosphoglucose/phosphomannose isomerase [Candidatus Omnitrophica bacterium]|nr:bifunctional phosphoglucose/phosphomannose isomerase [Candidatus Omnitrophota bacterium]
MGIRRSVNLDDRKMISKMDKENMLELLTFFPKQCEDALYIGKNTKIAPSYKKSYANIVFTGLGGSAIGADVVKGYLENELERPVVVNRNYTLPHFTGRDSLVFAISYSGNTEETLSAYNEAKKKNANVVVITSGGKLKDLALKNKDVISVIPKGYPPRCALGYSFIPALATLSKLGLIKSKEGEIKKAIRFLGALRDKTLTAGVKKSANLAKEIARKIYKKFPTIYASARMESAATRWRDQFAENAKTLSSMHVFPEMNHNEIVGWVNPRGLLKDFVAIILKDKDDHPRIQKRMEITKTIIRKEKFSVLEVKSQGNSFLERMLSLIYIGDFTSFYLAILNRINPTPVDRITYLKKRLVQ